MWRIGLTLRLSFLPNFSAEVFRLSFPPDFSDMCGGAAGRERAAELEERARVVEQQLPVITARLGILWNEVTGSGRPVLSEIQLT
jgi:hypothetical protein